MFYNRVRKQSLIKNFGEETGIQIYKKQVAIGMTKEMVTLSVGKLVKGEKVVRENTTKEIFFYGYYKNSKGKDAYKYKVTFDNGKVIEIRET